MPPGQPHLCFTDARICGDGLLAVIHFRPDTISNALRRQEYIAKEGADAIEFSNVDKILLHKPPTELRETDGSKVFREVLQNQRPSCQDRQGLFMSSELLRGWRRVSASNIDGPLKTRHLARATQWSTRLRVRSAIHVKTLQLRRAGLLHAWLLSAPAEEIAKEIERLHRSDPEDLERALSWPRSYLGPDGHVERSLTGLLPPSIIASLLDHPSSDVRTGALTQLALLSDRPPLSTNEVPSQSGQVFSRKPL